MEGIHFDLILWEKGRGVGRAALPNTAFMIYEPLLRTLKLEYNYV